VERKLATLRRVKELLPIEGADLIEVAVVDGWKVVVKKGEFKAGDLCIYCEIDSFLPIREEFEFLRKSSYKKLADGTEGFRLKTIKLRGQISQGLLLPTSILGGDGWVQMMGSEWPHGEENSDEITAKLGIVKYDPPVPANLAGKVKGNFPSFLKKTDEERVQNLADSYEELKKHLYYETEKLDGSSSTYFVRDGVFGVCSRNLELAPPAEPFEAKLVVCDDGREKMTQENSFWKVARELDLEAKMKSVGKNIALQGELVGEGVQKNPYKLKGQTVMFYNAFDIDAYEYLSYVDFVNLVKSLGLQTVPVLTVGFTLPDTIEELLQRAEGKTSLGSGAEREGIVVRSLDRKISFKVISNKFLLKNEE
jgi:RNA ligase (TIGR02306 family)